MLAGFNNGPAGRWELQRRRLATGAAELAWRMADAFRFDGTVYALAAAKGAVYRVDPAGVISRLGDTGRGNVQQVRCDATGRVWMSDGDGNGLGTFDKAGLWTKVYDVPDKLIWDFAPAAVGTVYASTWATKGDRRRRIEKVTPGGTTTLHDAEHTLAVALDPAGTLNMAGEGMLRKRVADAWQVVAEDARFDFGFGIGPGIAVDAKGRAYLASPERGTIVRLDPVTKAFTAIAGVGGKHFAGAAGADDGIKNPRNPAFDAAGNFYFANPDGRQIKRIAVGDL